MARDIPDDYPKPDPDRSFVPGTGRIDYGTLTDDPPHGPADLARAVRHLFGHGGASLLIPQMWIDDEACLLTSAAFDVVPSMRWRVPHDPAFTSFRLTVDYIATVAVVGGFEFRAVELNKERALNAVAAGGAVRRVSFDWTPAGMDRSYGNEYHTIEFYAKGDGTDGNAVVAVWLERLPAASPIPSGTWYEGAFIPPDSVAYEDDEPLSSDKVIDLIRDVQALHEKRLHCVLNWSAVIGHSAPVGSLLSTLIALRPDGNNRASACWTYQGGGDLTVYGGRQGEESDDRYTATVSDDGWKDFDLRIQGNDPLIAGRQTAQQVVAKPAVAPYLGALSMFGV